MEEDKIARDGATLDGAYFGPFNHSSCNSSQCVECL